MEEGDEEGDIYSLQDVNMLGFAFLFTRASGGSSQHTVKRGVRDV